MNNIRQIITERLENARNDYYYLQKNSDGSDDYKLSEIIGQMDAYHDCLNLIDEYTPKIVTKRLSVKEIETLLQDLNKPHQFIIDKPTPRTEADILKDFEKLGYRVIKLSTMYLFETDEEERRIWIHTDLKEYGISIANKALAFQTFTMQEHKLLNELFEVIFDE